jgi:hypothetical protein
MALFTDGISTIQDLLSQDSSVLNTAQTENIDLSTKLSLAQQGVGIELTTLLQRSNTYDWQFWLQPNPQLTNIVVTPPLQLWHVYQTLVLVYQDAYYNQLNDRYQGKLNQFQKMANWATDKLIQTGLGMVSDPIPQAAAPVLIAIPGGLSGMTYYASISWLNTESEEGQAGPAGSLPVLDGNALAVQPSNQPGNATAWNVFVGVSPDTLALQNPSPLPTDQIWVQATPISVGRAPGSGQAPDYLQALPRLLQRG